MMIMTTDVMLHCLPRCLHTSRTACSNYCNFCRIIVRKEIWIIQELFCVLFLHL